MTRICSLFPVSLALLCAGCSANEGTLQLPSSGGAAPTTAGNSGGVTATGGTSSVVSGGAQTVALGGAPVAATGGKPGSGGADPIRATGGRPTPPGLGGANFVVTIPPSALTTVDPTCGVQAFVRERKPPEMLLVLDRSASMQDPPDSTVTTSKWSMVVPPLTSVLGTTNSTISWGMKLFPELQNTDSCAPETIVSTIHIPVAPNNAQALITRINADNYDGDGTPTGDAVRFATAYLDNRQKTVNTNPKFILLATDGDPSCPSGDAAATYAVEQITLAATAGFPTYVIGVATTKSSSITRLNAMAVAGGRPRLGAATQFYLTTTQAELTTALQTITAQIGSCLFELSPPPPVPENIAVDFNGLRTPRDTTHTNGWDYTNANYTQLQVYGSWCERIKTEASNKVDIKYGCPGMPIPLPG